MVFGSDSQSAKCSRRQFPDRCKQLGSSSEVERFRVQSRDGLLVKRLELAKPTHFINLRHVGTPICGSQPNEHARFRPKTLKVVGSRRTGVNLHYQHLSLPPRHYLDIGNQAWPNRIRDYASQPLLGVEYIGNAGHPPGPILDTYCQDTPGRICKRNQGLQQAVWRGEVSLIFEGFSFRFAENFDEVHSSALYSEARISAALLGSNEVNSGSFLGR